MPHRSGVPAPPNTGGRGDRRYRNAIGPQRAHGRMPRPGMGKAGCCEQDTAHGRRPQGILSWLSPRRCLTVRDVPGRVPMELPCLHPRQGRGMRNGPDNALRHEDTPLCRRSLGQCSGSAPVWQRPPLDAAGAASYKGAHARMVELVDTRDLKSLGHRLCRFKPGSGYQKEKAATGQSCGRFFQDSCTIFLNYIYPCYMLKQ